MKTRYLKEHKPRKVSTPWMKGFTLPEKLDDLTISQLKAKNAIGDPKFRKKSVVK